MINIYRSWYLMFINVKDRCIVSYILGLGKLMFFF